MTIETRDPQFARFVEDQSNSLSSWELSFTPGVFALIAIGLVAVYDALATPEPGFLARAFKGMAV